MCVCVCVCVFSGRTISYSFTDGAMGFTPANEREGRDEEKKGGERERERE